MHLMNISGKEVKRPIKEVDLFRFPDEIVKIDLDERRQQALDTAEYFAKMAPGICKRGKDGKALIYGEDN